MGTPKKLDLGTPMDLETRKAPGFGNSESRPGFGNSEKRLETEAELDLETLWEPGFGNSESGLMSSDDGS